MRKLKHARELMQRARSDFNALRVMLDKDAIAEEIFGFHAQQAIEKALKAWIDSMGLDYPVTHNLGDLLDILKQANVKVEGRRYFLKFNLYAVLFRYVSPEGKIGPINRKMAIERIGELLDRIEKTFET